MCSLPSTSVSAATSYPVKPQRGRRPIIPPEQREQTRRMMKQTMERRRRANISDKLNALHYLAMKLIGIDPDVHQKAEKVDLLAACYKVLEGVAEVVRKEPELQTRLHQLRSQIPVRTNTPASFQREKFAQRITYTTEFENDAFVGNSLTTDLEDKEKRHIIHRTSLRLTHCPEKLSKSDDQSLHDVTNHPAKWRNRASGSSTDSGIHSPNEIMPGKLSVYPTVYRRSRGTDLCFRSHSLWAAQTGQRVPVSQTTPLLSPRFSSASNAQFASLSYPMRSVENLPMRSPSTSSKRVTAKDSTNSPAVWRPYL